MPTGRYLFIAILMIKLKSVSQKIGQAKKRKKNGKDEYNFYKLRLRAIIILEQLAKTKHFSVFLALMFSRSN